MRVPTPEEAIDVLAGRRRGLEFLNPDTSVMNSALQHEHLRMQCADIIAERCPGNPIGLAVIAHCMVNDYSGMVQEHMISVLVRLGKSSGPPAESAQALALYAIFAREPFVKLALMEELHVASLPLAVDVAGFLIADKDSEVAGYAAEVLDFHTPEIEPDETAG